MEDYKAIRYIEYHGHIDDEVKDIAIKAIKELHKYKAIGTVEEFKDLKGKAEPKKPIDKLMYLECPTCGDVGILDCGYCPVCGQKLDWDD